MVSRRRRALFASLPTLVALALLELVARVVESASTPDDLAAFDRAELARRAEVGELRRRDGETLVYVYGESAAWGVPVPEIGIVAQMQCYASRSRPGRDVRVVNLGVRGADSSQLRAVVRDTIGNRPDFAIVLCGHNEFLRAADDEPLSEPWRRSAAVRALVRTAARASAAVEAKRTPPGLDAPAVRSSDAIRAREERYRRNMEAIVRRAREERVPVVLATLPSNLRDWPPAFRRLAAADGDQSRQDAYQAAMEHGLACDERGDATALRQFVATWEAQRPDDPMVRYLRGRMRLAAGDRLGALEDLRCARDTDPIPCRMRGSLIDAVRELAAAERAPLVDMDAEFCDVNVPGLDVIVDNCHPSPEGSRRMAAAVLRCAEQVGLLPPSAADACPLEEFLQTVGYGPGSSLRLQFLVFNGQYAMRRPLYHYPIARRYLLQAVSEYPDAWVAHANLATLLLWQGEVGQAEQELRRAESLHAGPLDLADQTTVPFLEEAMRFRGLR